MMFPAGCRRSRECCSLDIHRSIGSSDDGSIRSCDGVEAESKVSTLHGGEKGMEPGWAQFDGEWENSFTTSLSELRCDGQLHSIDSADTQTRLNFDIE